MRPHGVLLAAVLVGVCLSGATAVGAPGDDVERPAPDRLITPDEVDGYVWPYTSRTRSVEGRTLALNVVVRGDSTRVRRVFAGRSGTDWSTVDRNATMRLSPWRPAHGSVRYTYVTPSRAATGRWTPAAYQLAVGSYFGRRVHVRAYPGPTGDWTALQAHTEYWDWFRIRHTVTGVATASRIVERDLRTQPFVERVSRSRHGHGGGSHGWWTVVDLAAAVVVVGPLVRWRPTDGDLPLVAALAALPLGVRAWGIVAETAFPTVTPKLFVAVGYPVLACGPPALVVLLAPDRPATRLAGLVAAGLGAGIVLDAVAVGIRSIPPGIVFHRLGLVVALGVLAFGTGHEERRVVVVGLAAWVGLLLGPLLGVV